MLIKIDNVRFKRNIYPNMQSNKNENKPALEMNL